MEAITEPARITKMMLSDQTMGTLKKSLPSILMPTNTSTADRP